VGIIDRRQLSSSLGSNFPHHRPCHQQSPSPAHITFPATGNLSNFMQFPVVVVVVVCSRVRFLDRQMFQLKPNSDSAHIPRQIQSLKLTWAQNFGRFHSRVSSVWVHYAFATYANVAGPNGPITKAPDVAAVKCLLPYDSLPCLASGGREGERFLWQTCVCRLICINYVWTGGSTGLGGSSSRRWSRCTATYQVSNSMQLFI